MNAKKTDLKSLTNQAKQAFEKARRFSLISFLCLVAILYGFVLLRISTLSNTQPSSDSVTSQINAAQVPHIDEKTVQQLESLQNNSVNVKALFNEARNNPFQN